MGQVKLEIGGRSFNVTCQDGEEDHLGKLGALVDGKAAEAGDNSALTESRMLLFTSLLLADELHGIKKDGDGENISAVQASASVKPEIDEKAVLALEKLADRVENFASGLEQ